MQEFNDNNLNELSGPMKGVLFLEGFLFMKSTLIQQNDILVQKAFEELYKYVSKN